MQFLQRRQRFWLRHPWITGAAVLGGLWMAVHADPATYPWLAVFGSATAYFAVRRHRRGRAIADAGLRARAELEHRLALVGDQRGIFGRYPPQQAGWFPDPARTGVRNIRYFDGVAWTGHTAIPSY